MKAPDVDCTPCDDNESHACKSTSDDNKDGAIGEMRGLEEGIIGDTGDDDWVGGDIRVVLCDARKFCRQRGQVGIAGC